MKVLAIRGRQASRSAAPSPFVRGFIVSYKNQWRVLIGDWRVLYIIDDAAKVVSIYVDYIGRKFTNSGCDARLGPALSCSMKAVSWTCGQ
jgi:hypothetical protein